MLLSFVFTTLLVFPSPQTSQPEIFWAPEVDILALDDEIRTFLEDNIDPEISGPRKVRALVDAIFSEEFLNLQYDNSHTKTAIETFQTRNGNCLSFTTMFVAMARHIGLDARFQEVLIEPTWNRRGNTIVLNRHINSVVYTAGRALEVDFNPEAPRKETVKQVVNDSRAIAQYYNNIAAETFADGEREKAVAYFEKALTVNSSLSFIWSNLGVAYRHVDKFSEAENAYLHALNLDENEYTAMANLAQLYSQTGKDKLAKRYRKRADNFRNKNPYYHFSLGEKAMTAERYEEALTHFRRAIARKRNVHDFYFAMAKTYIYLNKRDKAEVYLDKAREYATDAFNEDRYNQKLQVLAAMN